MAWVKLDDQFPDHWKLAELGEDAPLCGWLYVCGLAFCNRQLTDGRIPKAHVGRLMSVRAAELAERLVEVGLWEDADTHYVVHDYLDYQPTREKVLAERAATKERVAKLRGRRNAVTPDVQRAEYAACTVSPVPVPVPVPEPEPVPGEEMAPLKRRTRLPDALALAADWRAYAAGKGLGPVEAEFEKFCDYHRAKGSLMLDWFAAWRTWVSNAVGRFAPRTPAGGGNPKTAGNVAALQAFVSRGVRA